MTNGNSSPGAKPRGWIETDSVMVRTERSRVPPRAGCGTSMGSPLTWANLMRSSRPLMLTPGCPFLSPFSKVNISG